MSEMKIFSSKVAYIPDDYFLKNIKKNSLRNNLYNIKFLSKFSGGPKVPKHNPDKENVAK